MVVTWVVTWSRDGRSKNGLWANCNPAHHHRSGILAGSLYSRLTTTHSTIVFFADTCKCYRLLQLVAPPPPLWCAAPSPYSYFAFSPYISSTAAAYVLGVSPWPPISGASGLDSCVAGRSPWNIWRKILSHCATLSRSRTTLWRRILSDTASKSVSWISCKSSSAELKYTKCGSW